MTRARGVVAAEVERIKAYADADEAFARSANAAGTAFANASASAYVTFVNAALGAQLIYAAAVTNAMVTAASAAADAQGAAISNALGNTPAALEIGLAYASLLKARANAWAIETMGNIAADQLQTRAEVSEWRQQVSRDATATETAANLAAAAAVEAIKDDADEWSTAENRSITAARDQAKDEIDSDEEFAKDEATANRDQALRDNAAEATRASDLAFANYSDEVVEIVDEQTRVTDEANEGYQNLVNGVNDAKQPLKDKLGADSAAAAGAAAAGRKNADSTAEADEKLSVANAKAVYARNKQEAADAIARNRALDPVFFADKRPPTAATAFMFLAETNLDRAANFFVGWADTLTFGGFTNVVNWADPNYLQYINRNSLEYQGGTIVGSVHSMVLGGAATGGACTLNWAGNVSRVYTVVSTGVGMAQAADNIRRGEGRVWDYLAFAPAVGALANRAGWMGQLFQCFVGETQVAVGWKPADLVVDTTQMGASTGDSWSTEWIVSGTILLGAAVTMRRLANRRMRRVHRGRSRSRGLVAIRGVAVSRTGSRRADANALESPSSHPVDALFRGNDLPSDWLEEPQLTPFSTVPASATDGITQRLTADERPTAARWLWLAPLMLALACLWQGLPGSTRRDVASLSEPRSAIAATIAERPAEARTIAGPTLLTRRIDEIRIGSRVIGTNPLAEDTHRTVPEPTPATSRVIRLRLSKGERDELVVELLRPTTWIIAHQAVTGASIWLDLPEFGATGWALVDAVEPCPPLEPGSGQLVTGRFVHQSSGNLRRLWTDAEQAPTGVTGNHRYWSATRGGFVAVDDLAVGEELDTAAGRSRVRRIEADPRDQTVYNLEVHGEHVYRVGTAGVLVHNSYLFRHYGYAEDAEKFVNGLRPGAFATRAIGRPMSGRTARANLALPSDGRPLPNAYYKVRIDESVEFTGSGTVQPAFGQPGGGVEFRFPNGTPPGSVTGPFPIP